LGRGVPSLPMSSTVAGSGPIAEIIFKGLCCGQAQRVRLMDLFVNIDVNDLAKAIAFYERAVGVRVGRRFGSFGVEMLGATSPIYLLVKPDGTAPSGATSEVRRYQRHWTPVHLDFVVPDLDAAVDRAMEAGATCEGESQTHCWGRIAPMADPFGHGICFIQFLNRGYDEIADKAST
jgi:predicted enzyme related to lactoylglutathione lyase